MQEERRRCRVCGEEKSLDDFPRDRGARHGRSRTCHVCNRARAAAWRAANPERHASNVRRWKAANAEKEQARKRAWALANPELLSAIRRKMRQDRPALYRAKDARQRQRREAVKRGVFVEDVDRLVVLERDDGICGICGGDVDPMNFHVDHIVPINRGGLHCYANVQPSHPSCNSRKQDRWAYGGDAA